MNRETLLGLYDRLTSLVEKLPGGLQKPILRELVPIRELFLEQRPPRILLLGDPSPDPVRFLEQLLAAGNRPARPATPPPLPASPGEHPPPDLPPIQSGGADNGWRLFRSGKRGAVELLDARANDLPRDFLERAIARHSPDLLLLFHNSSAENAGASFEQAIGRAALADSVPPQEAGQAGRPALLGIATGPSQESGVDRLRALLHARRELAHQILRIVPADNPAEIAEAACAFLPNPAKLEFALFCRLRSAQAEIARSLLKSFTAVCGVIGMQPIPLADLPVLSTLQSLMAGLIAYTSGRRLGPKAVTEFLGAVGVSLGAGMLFREAARALIKIVPIWGNAVSGLVAGAGTYAIGRAAIAYFIEDLPILEARKLFRSLLPKKDSFRKSRAPRLPG